uniref:Uncharacterized protein n=1 Tax=viral metagenome TaxID=1070528 RepID=A0A6C0BN82_9ZZZZ
MLSCNQFNPSPSHSVIHVSIQYLLLHPEQISCIEMLSSIPEEIRFIIAEYCGQCIPGLSEEYILQELKRLNQHVIPSEHRWYHLLEFITNPYNVNVYSKLIGNTSDLSKMFSMIEQSNPHICLKGDDRIAINFTLSHPISLTQSIPDNIQWSMTEDGWILHINPEAFIPEFMRYNHISTFDHSYPEAFIFSEIHQQCLEKVSCHIHQITAMKFHHIAQMSEFSISANDLMIMLDRERQRSSIIQDIIEGKCGKHGITSEELNLIDYVISESVPLIISHRFSTPWSSLLIITEDCNVANKIISLLREAMRDCGVTGSRVDRNGSIYWDVGLIHRGHVATQQHYNLVDGGVYHVSSGLFRTMRLIQSLHHPMKTSIHL